MLTYAVAALRSCAPRPYLTLRQFASRYVGADGSSLRLTPWQVAYLTEAELWPQVLLVAPAQSGKSTVGHDIPLLWHSLELTETVLAAAPDEKTARDRFEAGARPTINDFGAFDGAFAPRMRIHARGRHPSTLRYMTGGGGDKSRASFTSRVVCLTEADGFDVVGGVGSREGRKLDQLRARQRAFPSAMRRWYAECTASTEDGYIWRGVASGTNSRLAVRHSCGAWVSPDREHLRGWQSAQTAREASRLAHWVCPACAAELRDEERRAMLDTSRIIHSGQTMTDNGPVGAMPDVDAFGLRVTAWDNALLPTGDFAADEWRAIRAPDPEAAERAIRQFVFALPAKIDDQQSHEVRIATRVADTGRRVRPDGAPVYVGIDVGKRYVYWLALAKCPDGTSIVIDYDQVDIPTDRFGDAEGIARGIVDTVASFDDLSPAGVLVDSGAFTECVYDGVRRIRRANVMASKGMNVKQVAGLRGLLYRVAPLASGPLMEFDADAAKSAVRSAMQGPTARPGAWRLYNAAASEHFRFERHVNAEQPIEEYAAGVGMVIRWHRVRSDNHFFDAAALAHVASQWARPQAYRPASQPIRVEW